MSHTSGIVRQSGAPWLIRVFYFLIIGWWATGIWINVAWFLNVTIVGLPLGLWMLNRVPQVLILRSFKQLAVTYERDGQVRLRITDLPQRPLLIRLVYFVLVGWWLSLLWSNAAWVISATVVGLPLGVWMFDRLPAITTLMRT